MCCATRSSAASSSSRATTRPRAAHASWSPRSMPSVRPRCIVAVDHEGGRVQRFRPGFSRAAAAAAHRSRIRSRSRKHGLDARASHGLAHGGRAARARRRPVVRALRRSRLRRERSHRRPRVSSKPEAVAQLALAYMQGMRDAGMAATAKHFPGHGAVVADSHQSLPVDRRDWTDLADDLLPYRRLIANGLPAVMVAHVLFPAVDARAREPVARAGSRTCCAESCASRARCSPTTCRWAARRNSATSSQRATAALDAGCDVLPVCNDRAARRETARRARTRNRSRARICGWCACAAGPRPSAKSCCAGEPWRGAQELLARSAQPPALKLTAGNA